MISAELLDDVSRILARQPALAGVDAELRLAFPGVMFTLCNDNDIPSRQKPLRLGKGFALYGINTSGHCATLAADLDSAGGLAVALIDDEE